MAWPLGVDIHLFCVRFLDILILGEVYSNFKNYSALGVCFLY